MLTYLWIAGMGIICIAAGIAVQFPPFGRWSFIVLLGLPLLAMGIAGLCLRATSPLANIVAQSDGTQLRTMLVVGMLIFAAGVLGAVHTGIKYEIPPAEQVLEANQYREASWMKWVYVAALAWSALGGCGITATALGATSARNR